jgi:hypothetical protein
MEEGESMDRQTIDKSKFVGESRVFITVASNFSPEFILRAIVFVSPRGTCEEEECTAASHLPCTCTAGR